MEYRYKSLDHEFGKSIRLLHLKPGKFENDLECEIIHANLLDKPKYEAISYTWADENGDYSPSSQIRCIESNSVVNITKNCEAALRRIRLQSTTRVIWIDSICIDQSETAERNHQVRQMGDIYASAEQVVVYVGEESVSSRKVVRYLSMAIITQGNTSTHVTFPPKRYLPSQEAVTEFLSRRWFHRVWVLQEVGLARRATVLCGARSLDWSLFSVDRLSQGGLSSQAIGDITPGVLLLETSLYKQRPGMMDLLHAGRSSLSSDPRDKVFALLGLGNAKKDLGIQPDYSQTAEWLFTHVAVQLIKTGSCLDVLAHARRGTQYRDLPSWVPDWTILTEEKPLRNQFSDGELSVMSAWNFAAELPKESRSKEAKERQPRLHDLSITSTNSTLPLFQDQVKYSSQIRQSRKKEDTISFLLYAPNETSNSHVLHSLPTRLIVRAHRVAIVTSNLWYNSHVCTTCTERPCLQSMQGPVFVTRSQQCDKVIDFWKHMIRHTLKSGVAVAKCARIPPAFGSHARCLSCEPHVKNCEYPWLYTEPNRHEWHYDLTDRETFARDGELEWDSPSQTLNPCSGSHYSRSALASFMAQKSSYAKGRVVFSTRESLGLGPMSLCGGDEVWLLDNCRVALALRRVEQHYEVLGDCYVYGALNAQHPCPTCGRGIEWAEPIETAKIEIW